MRKLIVVLSALLLATVVMPVDGTDADESPYVLIDMGNGTTYWSNVQVGGTCIDIVTSAASAYGLDVISSGGTVKRIGCMENHAVGTQECSWKLFVWKDGGWEITDDIEFKDTSIAWGFYPAGIIPAETPEHRSSWTQSRGDSSSSGVSDSYGTRKAVSPVEWYKIYTTGFIDSSIIVAGNNLYHTTYGDTSSSSAKSHSFIYCLDRTSATVVWKFDITTGGGLYPDITDNGFNITSPLVIGDMVIINSATSHSDSDGHTVMATYCLDRFTGELIDHVEIRHNPPTDEMGNIKWTGRTFINGGTTPVYDSGAIYFGTSDGRILAFSVSREQGFQLLWENVPNSDKVDGEYIGTRGSFYYHSPVILDIGGKRTLFIGNYEGYLFSVDASTGISNWEQRIINLGKNNKVYPNTPGSVSTITNLSDGRIAVSCTDGGMSPIDGYTVCLDASEGGKEIWKINYLLDGMVTTGDGFVAYSPVSNLSNEKTGYLCRFDSEGQIVWSCGSDYVKSALTIASGVVYAMDYTAGAFEGGGCLTATDLETGKRIWDIRLEPYSGSSYSMVAPTVIDGKIYVANDYGCFYCVSEIEGKKWDGGEDIVLENDFTHWSWLLLFFSVCLAALIFWRLY